MLIDIDDFYLISEDMTEQQQEVLINSVLEAASYILKKRYSCTLCRSDNDYLIALINRKPGKDMELNEIVLNELRFLNKEQINNMIDELKNIIIL